MNCSYYPSATKLADGPPGKMQRSVKHCKSRYLVTWFLGAGFTRVQKEKKHSEHNDSVREHRIQFLKWGKRNTSTFMLRSHGQNTMQSMREPTSSLREITHFCQGPCKNHVIKGHLNWIVFAHCDKQVAQKLSKGMLISVRRTFYDHRKDTDSHYEVAKVCMSWWTCPLAHRHQYRPSMLNLLWKFSKACYCLWNMSSLKPWKMDKWRISLSLWDISFTTDLHIPFSLVFFSF